MQRTLRQQGVRNLKSEGTGAEGGHGRLGARLSGWELVSLSLFPQRRVGMITVPLLDQETYRGLHHLRKDTPVPEVNQALWQEGQRRNREGCPHADHALFEGQPGQP